MPRQFRRNRNGFRKKRVSSKMKNAITRVIRSKDEPKHVDIAFAGVTTPILGTSLVTYITGLSQGSSNISERIGDNVTLVSFQILGNVFSGTDVLSEQGIARIMLVRARTSVKGVLPVVTDILKTDAVDSLRLVQKQLNYKVLWDKRYFFNANLDLTSVLKPIEKFKSLGGLKCSFNGASSAITTAEAGGLYLITMSNEIAGDQQTWTFNLRTTYKEF